MAELGKHLADVLLRAKVYGLTTPPGEPPLQQAQLSIVGDDAALTIPVLPGDEGPPGAPAKPFDWQQPQLASAGELPTLTPADAGAAYVINDGSGTADIAYWTGTVWQYFVDCFGPGLPGPVPDITATAEVLAPEADAEVVVSGTAAAPNLHFRLPGLPGPVGPSGGWDLFDAAAPRPAGAMLTWDADGTKWRPTAPTALPRTLRYTLPEAAFTDYAGTAASQTIASLSIPPQPVAYHVDVHGHVRVGQQSGSSAQAAIVVRLGDAASGQQVAKGLAVTAGPCTISPHYSSQDTGKQASAAGPGSATGRVPAATAATLYVVAVRAAGSGGWTCEKADAQLSVTVIPDL
ncbi:MAG: hypothetical protein QM809_11550 [Gordonia sp. (in: high G+C Gram-positive bacteria)]|uniref:hypothetical protein n=1 Tax=Gordonia sp. (in: high G+C Gram-positive bacteria) TaxID=84139 RepID=UPI0039E4AD07